MSIVVLVSGGLDSSLVVSMAIEDDVEVLPLFIDYGQLAAAKEWAAAKRLMESIGAPAPERLDVSGFGELIPSGLTRTNLRRNEDAFLPGRNLLFLVVAASFAASRNASAIAIGLLDEASHIFPDQTREFISRAEAAVKEALGLEIRVLAPLIDMPKSMVIALMNERGLAGTYSCHEGGETPCGECISCREILGAGGN
jgi:7-cyano-7-deazaguanine synthase